MKKLRRFTRDVNGHDARGDHLGIVFHPLLGRGQRQRVGPVSLLVQRGGDVRDGALGPVA